jgi:hypothetical protein
MILTTTNIPFQINAYIPPRLVTLVPSGVLQTISKVVEGRVKPSSSILVDSKEIISGIVFVGHINWPIVEVSRSSEKYIVRPPASIPAGTKQLLMMRKPIDQIRQPVSIFFGFCSIKQTPYLCVDCKWQVFKRIFRIIFYD